MPDRDGKIVVVTGKAQANDDLDRELEDFATKFHIAGLSIRVIAEILA